MSVDVDLGDVTTPARPVSGRPGRRRGPAGLIAALLAIAIVYALTGSAPAPPTLGAPVWSRQSGQGELIADRDGFYLTQTVGQVAFVVGDGSTIRTPGVQQGTMVTAVRADTGSRRWRVALPLPESAGHDALVSPLTAVLAPSDGPLLISLLVGGSPSSRVWTTVALDRGTGRELLRVDGFPRETGGGGYLPISVNPVNPESGYPQPGLVRGPVTGDDLPSVEVVSLRAGQVAWRTLVNGVWFSAPTNGPARWLVNTDAEGVITVHAMATGEVLARARLARPPQAPGSGSPGESQSDAGLGPPVASVVGDMLLAEWATPDNLVVAGYHLETLARAWVTTLTTNLQPDAPGSAALPCEPLACVNTGDGETGLDPATGRVIFTGMLRPYIAALPRSRAGVFFGDVRSVPPRVAIAPGFRGVQIVDMDTGRTINTLPDWRASAALMGADGAAVLYQEGGGRTTFALLTDSGRGLRPIGTVSGESMQCAVSGHWLGCLDRIGLMRGWRLPTR